jgi:signal transduction histidine kinase
LQDKKKFVRYISHELRTPLNVVYMALQLLQKQGVFPVENKRIAMSTSHSGCGPCKVEGSFLGRRNSDTRNPEHGFSSDGDDRGIVTGCDAILEPDDTVSSDDVISDACDACQLAVNILNNLLMHDRIEDGKMMLRKQNVAVRSLLIQCIRLFEVQVCQFERAVRMSYRSLNGMCRLKLLALPFYTRLST